MPGACIPDALIHRLECAENPAMEGVAIAAEQVKRYLGIVPGVQLLEKLVFGRYCVGKDGDHFDLQEASLDWLITDARRQDLVEPSPQQKAMAELLGTDLTQAAS